MKTPSLVGCLLTLLLGAPLAFAGSHHSQSVSSIAPAHAARPATAAPGSSARFQPAGRNFNRPMFGGQAVTNTARFSQQRFANQQHFNNQQRFGNQQRFSNQNRLNNQQQRFASRGRFSERARVAARSHSSDWWRHHHHDRIVFINTFGCDPLFFDPFFFGYYPYYGYPYGYYYDGYPYGSDGYGPGYYGSGYGPNYDQSDRSYDDSSPGYSYEQSSGRQGGGGAVLEVQKRLAREGYYHGSIDGLMGSRTRYAIRAYERDHGLQADGEIDQDLLRSMGVR